MDTKTPQEQRQSVITEARTWIRTPFHHRSRVKGKNGGVDCANLLCEVYEKAGCVPPVHPEAYTMQCMLHDREERFIRVLEIYGREIPESEAKAGDAVVWKCGRSYSHGAILIEDWPGLVIHSVTGLGVMYAHGTKDGFLSGRKDRKFFTLFGGDKYAQE